MQAVIVAQGPTIDGTLESPVWQACPSLELGECTSTEPGMFPTTARLLFDATHLYVAFDCAEPDTAGLAQNVTERDGQVWQDDCVEVFVTGDPREGYFHFVVNPRGTLADAVQREGAREETPWDSSTTVKTSIIPGERWIATMSVPLRELAAYVGDNETWVINLNRTRPARGGEAIAEWSWAVMGSNDYHQAADYGRVEGVRVEQRADGVTRRASPPPLPPTPELGEEIGGITRYRHWDQMTIPDDGEGTNKTIDLRIANSDRLKVAFLARGTGGVKTAQFNLFDERAKDNTTSDSYRWVDDSWRPILYRCDRFVYNDGMTRRVAQQASFQNLRFHGNQTPGGHGRLELRHFVIYRGEDNLPPAAPTGITASSTGDGVQLSWKDAADNVGVAIYVVSRAAEGGKFFKAGQTCEPAFVDRPAAGTYRYRVLAVDFEGNVGPWSEAVRVAVPRGFEPAASSVEESDRVEYADSVCAIAAAGAGKVVRGRVLCFGDSLTGATLYGRFIESALGCYDVWARGYEGQRTDFGRNKIDEDLAEVKPEYCLIMLGTNNSKSDKDIPAAMNDLLTMAKSCQRRGTIPIVATIPPRGFDDPASEPEARYNRAVVALCRDEKIPVAYVFEAFQAAGDRRRLLADDGIHLVVGGWEVTANAWRAAVDQVNYALLDRQGEIAQLKATADIWLSDADDQERNTSAGKYPYFKIKNIQEMAAIRFDASAAKGREVSKATLFLRRASRDMLRYVRISTVNQDWVEGSGRKPYGPPDGATYLYADAATKRPWAWPGSEFCDVVMTSGNSLASWAERKEMADGWIAVALTPELIYAMVAGDTDGLAVMDGGNPANYNNMIYSANFQGSEPYIEVELGKPLVVEPAKPIVDVVPAPGRFGVGATSASGQGAALKVTIQEARDAFCWRLAINGNPVQRWRIAHPQPSGATVFYLEDLPPAEEIAIDILAVSRGGAVSAPARVVAQTPPRPSPALALGPLDQPAARGAPPIREGQVRVWAFPGLVKLSPENSQPMYDDLGADYRSANAVWDGQTIRLFGARGEYLSYQLCIERLGSDPLTGIRVSPSELKGPDGLAVTLGDIELFKTWYAQNRDRRWQPAYCVPIKHDAVFQIPDPLRGLAQQQNQSVYADLYVPKDARPGDYRGAVTVQAEGAEPISIPVWLTVFDFVLPDRLSFWAELNAYQIPAGVDEYYRLAHQHRCVANYWRFAPRLEGSGRTIQVVWNEYDRDVGPLLSGAAFKNNRRAGMPPEVMYLPFEDSWPTPLSKQTYRYSGYWPQRGDSVNRITEHYLTAPYIGDALSREYQDAFLSVQRQFIEHFKRQGYTGTEMQCFYGGKNTHRIEYGTNMWWTTDEPYHWDDWLALQFFCALWTQGRGEAAASQWAARADISRPQWQGRVLDRVVNAVYYGAGATTSPSMFRRCRTLAEETGLDFRVYGSASADNESNTRSVAWLLDVWLNGARAALPWQTLGDEQALDSNDGSAGGGNALLVPGNRLGYPVVADMRLKALRDGQQIVEYLALLAARYKLQRQQVKAVVEPILDLGRGTRSRTAPDNADALQFGSLKDWQIAELRRSVAELILEGH